MKLYLYKSGWVSNKCRQKIEALQPEQVKKIAVIRHAALGDMILTRPFLIELKRHFPNAKITLSVVSNYTRGVPDDLVDRVHVLFGSDQRDRSSLDLVKSARELGDQDIIFDVAATSRSYWVCALNKAYLKIGFPNEWYRHLIFYDVSICRSDLKFEAEVMLEMLNMFGFRTEFPLNYALPFSRLKEPKPYIVYFTGASASYKRWPDSSFSSLIHRMADEFPDVTHEVLQGIREDESVDEIMTPLGDLKNVNVASISSLQETIDFVGNAMLVVSNCTGIRHLAIATNTPTVGIYFGAAVFRYWPRDGMHEVAHHPDFTIPTVDDVYNRCVSHLAKVSEIRRID